MERDKWNVSGGIQNDGKTVVNQKNSQ
jgi:hypothetical protein